MQAIEELLVLTCGACRPCKAVVSSHPRFRFANAMSRTPCPSTAYGWARLELPTRLQKLEY